MVTAQLICAFVFAFSKTRFSHDANYILFAHQPYFYMYTIITKLLLYKTNDFVFRNAKTLTRPADAHGDQFSHVSFPAESRISNSLLTLIQRAYFGRPKILQI